MLRYKTETRPGLVPLYDIRPGNGAGQFLQRQSPHGACVRDNPKLRSPGAVMMLSNKVKGLFTGLELV